jgi:nitrous oxide reductase
MLEQPEQKTPRTLRKMWMGFSVLAAIVLGYTAFVFWSRWQENQDIAAKQKTAQAAAQRDAAEKSVEVLGGSEFKIISFYATPGKIQRGDTVDMCYGVSNAKSVKLDPPVADVWPSVDRCMQVAPKRTTTYTFTADDGKGNTKTAQLTIEVR